MMPFVNFSKQTIMSATNTRLWNVWKVLLISFVLGGCSVTKHIPDRQSLYDKVEIKIEPQGEIRSQGRVKTRLETLVPKTDKSLWGWRPSVWLYYEGKA